MDRVSIDISAYLSDEERKEIATDVFRSMCREACQGNHVERILDNIGHSVAGQIVVEALGDAAVEKIRDKALSVIDELSAFTVFRRPDVWERQPSPAYETLMSAVKQNKDLVEKKVRECISQLSKREALEIIKASALTIKTGEGQ